MTRAAPTVTEILDRLETHYGAQTADWPTDPYLFLLWWHSGYPQSDAACRKGWAALNQVTRTDCESVLNVPTPKLSAALAAGGMVPEIRALRMKEIAARVKDEFGGDLQGALIGEVAKVRRTLKQFPGIGDPGTDRILLFGGIAPVAAVPSNCPDVILRMVDGRERASYNHAYKDAQAALDAGVAASFDARTRGYLLLKRHGQEICKRSKPKCDVCPVNSRCAYYKAAGIG